MLGETVGSANVTASGYLITRTIGIQGNNITDHPEVVITHIHLVSSSTASVLTIQNGQNGSTWVNITGTISKGIDFDFGMWGITFPLGAYITVDGNIVNAVFTFKANKA